MRKFLVFILCFVASSAYGQQDTAKVPDYGWKHSLVAGLTLTQVAFTNWAAGGQSALSWTTSLEGKSANDQQITNWTTSYKFGFGQTRSGDQGLRKTDDKIDLETILTYKLGTYINPYAAATFKSQFAKGFTYDDDAGTKTAVSQFFDPAYLTQSAGVEYQPIPGVKTRFGAAVREIITSDFPSYADDPNTPEIEKTSVDGGLESVAAVRRPRGQLHRFQTHSRGTCGVVFQGQRQAIRAVRSRARVLVQGRQSVRRNEALGWAGNGCEA